MLYLDTKMVNSRSNPVLYWYSILKDFLGRKLHIPVESDVVFDNSTFENGDFGENRKWKKYEG
jgi:hypothetical protein